MGLKKLFQHNQEQKTQQEQTQTPSVNHYKTKVPAFKQNKPQNQALWKRVGRVGLFSIFWSGLSSTFSHLGHDVILILENEAALSVVFVPVQLHDQWFLVQVQFPLFCHRDGLCQSEIHLSIDFNQSRLKQKWGYCPNVSHSFLNYCI